MSENWIHPSIADIISCVKGGGTPSRHVPGFWKTEIPWATVKDFKDDLVSLSETQEFISNAGLQSSAATLIEDKVPILCTRMAVGRCAIPEMPVAINQDLKALYPNEKVTAEYLLWLLLFNRSTLQNESIGSTVKGISIPRILSLRVDLPENKSEQGVIVEKLLTSDLVIRQTKEVINKLQKIKTGLLHDLLTRGVDENGELRDPEKDPELFKDSPLGLIPKVWDVVPLADLCPSHPHAIVDGPFGSNLKSIHYRDSGIPVIQSGYVTSGRFNALSYYYVTESLFQSQIRSKVEPGDIVMAKIGANCGTCAVMPANHPIGILAGNALKITTDQTVCRTEFLLNLLHYYYHIGLMRLAMTETAQPAISLKNLKKLVFPKPNVNEQDVILEHFHAHISVIDNEHNLLNKYQRIKQGLMQDLLTGRVRVPIELIEQSKQEPEEQPAMPSPVENSSERKANVYFKRAVLAAEIADRLHGDATFGRTKFMKVLYLVEQEAELDLESQYIRAAAGPFDNKLIRSVEKQLKDQKWFKREKRKDAYGSRYVPMENAGGHSKYYGSYWGAVGQRIDHVIGLLRPLDTDRCEIIATLYKTWSDFISEGTPVTGEALADEIYDNWPDTKKRFSRDRWIHAYEWMIEKGVVPEKGAI